ncbi:MAG: divergent PAP2 family protein [Spirochaetia bacterium]|nr:divergent PAP2 family protein [Spirochaetia bacterium]
MANIPEGIWDIFVRIVTNRIFYITFTSWFVAQFLKLVIYFVQTKKFNFRLLVGTGGMPSSHTATVTAVTTCVGLSAGWESPVFMVSLCYCIVVISDAMGVRRAAGKQAQVLNVMMDEFGRAKFNGQRLKELLGHTPLEATAGILLGILIPVIMF